MGGGFTNGGIQGQYYNSTNLSGPVAFTRQDVRIDFNWGTVLTPGGSNSPNFAGIGHNDFSVLWTGQLIPQFSQTYTFQTVSAAGVQLFVKPASSSTWTTLINDWTAHTTTTDNALMALVAGQTYDVKMEYYQTTGTAVAELNWSSPSTPLGPIEAATVAGDNPVTYDPILYADAMKSGRTTWEGGVPQDSNGWPLADGTNIPWEGVDPASVAGTYLLTFSGEAQVGVQVFGPETVVANGTTYTGGTLPKGAGYDAATNTTTATVKLTANNSGILYLSFTNSQRTAGSATDTGVTNVSLMRPTSVGASSYYAPGTVFTTAADDAMAPFTVERWVNANNDVTQVNWSDRTLPSYFKPAISTSEVWEDLVMFSNETGKDLYITVPMNASSQYVTDLANLIKYGSDGVNPYTSYQANPVYPGLNPNLRVYIEWSNETWNPGFAQNAAAMQDSATAVADDTAEGQIINFDGNAPDGNFARWTALKTVEASNVFRQIWSDAAMGNQVRVVLEYQYYNLQNTAESELNFINDYFNNGDGVQHVSNPQPVSYYIWGAGGAVYFGPNNTSGYQTAIVATNASFETPALPAGTATVDPTGAGWTFSGNSGITTGGETSIGAVPTPPDGNQAAFIGDTASISTTINFSSTGVFAIELQDAAISPANSLHFYLDGVEITPNGIQYQPTSIPVTPGSSWSELDTAPFTISTTGNHTLQIVGAGAVGTYALVDDIKITSLDAMLNSGIFGLGNPVTTAQAADAAYQAQLNEQASDALQYGLNVVAYEGGWDEDYTPLEDYAKYVDPRSGQEMTLSLSDFAESGGALYIVGTYDSWPVSDTQDAASYPIPQGIAAFNANLPPAGTNPATSAFNYSTNPSLENLYDSAIVSNDGAELGMEFTSASSGYIAGVRFWKGTLDTGVHTGELWSSSGQLLATATFINETSGGWQQVYFSSPVQISANTTYIVSYHTDSPYIAYTPQGVASGGITNQQLTLLQNGVSGNNGLYSYGPTSFPTNYNGQAPNFWVDVVFLATLPSAPSAPNDLTGTANSSSQVTLDWFDSVGPVTAYHVLRSTDDVNFTQFAELPQVYQYVDSTAQPGTTYWYAVEAEDVGAFSPYAVVQVTTPPAPPSPPPPPATQTILSASSSPAASSQSVNDPPSAGGVELGMKFTSAVSGYVDGVRFWKSPLEGGAQSGELWSASGQLLATASFSNETASGWQQVNFSSPVAISANATYIISYHTNSSYLAYTASVFGSSINSGSLTALSAGAAGGNDVYAYGASATFPSFYNGQAGSYWVDVVFSATTTAPPPPPSVDTIFSSTAAPASDNQNISASAIPANGGAEVGVEFTSSVAGVVTGVRFWKGTQNTGVHTGELWSSTGQLLASATFTNESASGWQQVNFSSPVAISPNTVYIVSYHTTAGYIAYTPGGLAPSGVDNSPLDALPDAVYAYGTGAVFPSLVNPQTPNYWVDVVFSPT